MTIWAFGAVVLSRGVMSQEEEKGKGSGEVGEELSVGGGHAVAFSIHLYTQNFALATRVHPAVRFREFWERLGTFGSFLFYKSFQEEIKRFATHLSGEHEEDLDLARRPDERHVDYAERLRDEGEPGAEVGDGVGGVLGKGELVRLTLADSSGRT